MPLQFKTVESPYHGTCLSCKQIFHYQRYLGMLLFIPHFYCDNCSSVIHRRSDFSKIVQCENTLALAEEIVKSLPPCPCGGQFTATAGPHCPHCHQQLIVRENMTDCFLNRRIHVVEGAKVCIESSVIVP